MDGTTARTCLFACLLLANYWHSSVTQTAKPLHTAPMFTSEPEDTLAEPAAPVTLNCAATGNPPPVFTWSKDGAVIDIPTKTQLTLTATGSLVIKQFDANEDAGKYQCIATTSDSAVRLKILSRPAQLRATESPSTFKQQPLATTGFVGGVVRLGVDINASPAPDIVWKYLGKSTILSSDDRFTVLPQGVLVIRGLKTTDEGEIRAIARLSNGQYVNSDYVQVSARPAADRPADKLLYFLGRPQDISLTWGKSTILECAADSSAAVAVTWLKDGSQVQYGARASLYGGTHLKLSYVTEAESGMYTCEMTSGSRIIQASATVTVQVPPAFTLVPSKQYGRVDSSATFKYKVHGSPKPAITWYKDGIKSLSTADFLVFKDGSLTLNGIISNDAGMYQVFAANAAGVAQATTELIVLERGVEIPTTVSPQTPTAAAVLKPGKVKNVNSYPTSPTSVTVAWQKPDVTNGDIEKYVIVYFSSVAAVKRMIVNGTQQSAILSGLSPSTTYNIRLQAVNQYSGGSLSSTITVTTPQQTPPMVPSLTTVAPTPDSIYVSWPSPPSGTVIPKYVLYFVDVTNAPLTILSRETTSTSLLIGSLRPDTMYKFWVVPHNSDMAGPRSQDYTITTPKAAVARPGAVGNVAASAASPSIISLTWTAPTSGDPVTQYEVRVSNADQPGAPFVTRTTSTTNAYLTGLLPDTNYRVSVVPFSAAFVGPASVPLLTKTPADIPSQSPGGFVPGTVTPNSVVLGWVPLTKTQANGAVSEYKLDIRIAGKKDSARSITFPAPANEYTLSGLDPGTVYVLKLASVTSAGIGPYSDPLRVTTTSVPAGNVPSAPLNFAGTPLVNSPGVVTLSWLPPLESNGVIQRYSVVKVPASDAWTQMTTSGAVLSINVTNLDLDSSYDMQIFATNQFGDGQKSSLVSVVTLKEKQYPGIPHDLRVQTTRSSLVVTWQPPKYLFTLVRGYHVTIRKASTREELLSTPLDGRLNTRLQVTDKIDSSTAYEVNVVAVNRLGSSPIVEATASTQGDVVLPVSRQHLSIGPTSMAFNWTDSRQGMLSTYYVKYFLLNANSERVPVVVKVTSPSVDISGLTPYTQYSFYIRREDEPIFPAIPLFIAKTKSARSTMPLDVTARTRGRTWLDLSWQAPAFPNGRILRYIILYTTDNDHIDRDRVSITTPDSGMVYNVTDLTVGTRYYFTVYAVNTAGAGAKSAALATSTGGAGGPYVPGGTLPLGGGGGGFAANLWWIILAIILFLLLLLLLLLILYCCCCHSGGCLCCQKWCPCCWYCWLCCCLPCCLCCCPCCCRKHKKTTIHDKHLYVATPVGAGGSIASSSYRANGYASLDAKAKHHNGDAPPDLWVNTANGNAMEMSTLRSNGGMDLTMHSAGNGSIRSSSHSLNKPASLSGHSNIKVAVPGDSTFISYKTSLQDYCQKIGWLPPTYATQQYKGGFTGTSTFAGQSYSSGADYGATTVEAEQRAAFAALMSLGALVGGCKFNSAANIAVPSPGNSSFISYKCSLHDFCQQCNILPPRFTTSKQGGMYASQVQVGSHMFSMDNVLTSRQDAEQQVAFAALKGLCMAETGAQYSPNACFTVAGPGSGRFVSFKSSLHDFCQQYKLPPPQYITTQTVQGYSAKLKFGGLFFQSNDYLPTRLEAEQHAAFEALQGLGLLESSVQFGSGDTERIGHGSTLSVNSIGQGRVGGGSRYGSSSQLSQSSHASESFLHRSPQPPRRQFGSSEIHSGYASGDGGLGGHTHLLTYSQSAANSPAPRLRSTSFEASGEVVGGNAHHHQRSYSSSTSYQQTNIRSVNAAGGRGHESTRAGLAYRQPGIPSTRSNRIYGSASHVNEYSAPSYLETRSASHPALSDLENEMAGLEGLIRDLNGITSSERGKETYA